MKEFLYSRNAVYETLRAQRRQVFGLQVAEGAQEKGRLAEILRLAEERRIPVRRVPRLALDKIQPAHQGVILEAGAYPYVTLADILDLADCCGEPPFLLLLDTLNDPQNFGTLLRTAEAVGVHGVLLPLARTVEVTPAVVNASSGASEHLLIARMNLSQAIDELREAGVWTIGLDQAPESRLPSEVSWMGGGLALVVGSEGAGIRPLVKSKCDFLVRLPMQGKIESLNAAVAGSVALYLAYLARQQPITHG
ncbi:MAG: 23S rRNA (guanosine(2251)-2'-O)-methyltransferase RlmB [Anaerolineales bacterium]|nr:23S rRNA (guanosine(2251)-2'-O)-methyltransferase RlmB [Anaerolineales bacterium]MCX7609843.1 23S rRNA (guanosine(2251)-2'-O)-methyltransferase RlmB [Anaerolineales bacterium]MDW8227324.1 23S rRNA (guanosine(2251)-2'-O)-methyltransferase RlmB [Anaerolineales bacterium]